MHHSKVDLSIWKEDVVERIIGSLPSSFDGMDFVQKGSRWLSRKHFPSGEPDSKRDWTTNIFQKGGRWCLKDFSGSAYGIIDAWAMWHNISTSDWLAIEEALCREFSLDRPTGDPEVRAARQLRQTALEGALDKMEAALWSTAPSDEAKAVKDYLHGRGWKDVEIRAAHIGVIDMNVVGALDYPQKEAAGVTADGRIGTTHALAIPYRAGSSILGVKYRTLEPTTSADKYLNSKGLEKSKAFLGISYGVKDLLIVEGDLDSIHFNLLMDERDRKDKDIRAVATGGSAIGQEQLADAIRRGAERFTLMFDNDEAGHRFTAQSLDLIENAGKMVYIASLEDSGHKDVDEYLCQEENGLDSLLGIINGALPSHIWRLNAVTEKWRARVTGEGVTMKDRESILADIGAIAATPTLVAHPELRADLYNAASPLWEDLGLTADGVKFSIERAVAEMSAQEEEKRLKEAEKMKTDALMASLVEAHQKAKSGDTDGAIKVVQESIINARAIDKEKDWASDITPLTYEAVKDMNVKAPTGLSTGIAVRDVTGAKKEKLTWNTGLTFICGSTGNGKTSLLNQIALGEAKRCIDAGNNNCVLYLTREESRRVLVNDLINAYINEDGAIHGCSTQDAIIAHFKGNDSHLVDPKAWAAKEKEFIDTYLASGRLLVIDKDYSSEETVAALTYYLRRVKPSLICLDYAQLLFSEENSRLRTEEIKRIVKAFNTFAKETQLPVLMAAQFNQQVLSPLDMTEKNIGEGGDWSRIAEKIIGVFLLKNLRPVGKDVDPLVIDLMKNLGAPCTTETDKYKVTQLPDKALLKVIKSRSGESNLYAIAGWNGRTKHFTFKEREEDAPTHKHKGKVIFAGDDGAPF